MIPEIEMAYSYDRRKIANSRSELLKQPMGTVLSYKEGGGFSERTHHVIRTKEGYALVENFGFSNALYSGQRGPKVDLDVLIEAADAGKVGMVVEGVEAGQKIKHPLILEGLPKGARVAQKGVDETSEFELRANGNWFQVSGPPADFVGEEILAKIEREGLPSANFRHVADHGRLTLVKL